MAATLEISESNGVGQTVTNGITNGNFGIVDAPNLNPASSPVPAGSNSFGKYWRLRLVSLGTSNRISSLKVWVSYGLFKTGEAILCSLRTSGYAAPAYAMPGRAAITGLPFPTVEPSGPNLGIGGSLVGILTAPGYSDYLKCQLQCALAMEAGNTDVKTITFEYDEA
jgi:hypothetical protein